MSSHTLKRRTLLQWAGLSVAATGCGGGGSAAAPSSQPNVVVVVIDDLNDWVGYLGNTQVITPHIDALAARSTAFLRAYCNDPLCNPSRSSAWSGLSVQDTQVYDNWASLRSTNPSAVLLQNWMQQHGYEVAQYGKVNHVYSGVPEPYPPALPANNQQCSGIVPGSNPEGAFDWAGMAVDDSAMPDYQYTQSGIDFLNQPHGAPFMLCVGMVRSHLAWYVPQQYIDLYPLDKVVVPTPPPNDLADIPPAGQQVARWPFDALACVQNQGLWASAVQAYLASITFVDGQVGRLMSALDASAYADNTVVVLWSDNGFHLGQKFHWNKQALWEQTTRVPFIVRTPGQTQGATVSAAVSLYDFMPTVLDLTGVAAPYALAGRSLRPLLQDAATPWDHPVVMTNAVMDAQNKYATGLFDYAVRTNQWRYIRYRDGSGELYDDLGDPQEITNLAGVAANSSLIASLNALLPA